MDHKLCVGVFIVLVACVFCCGNRCSRDTGDSRGDQATRDTSASPGTGEVRDSRSYGSDSAGDAEARPGDPQTSGSIRAVDDGSAPATRRLTSMDDRVPGGNPGFAFRLLKKACGAGEPKNLFISPLSISVALAMTYNGASAKTADEMADVLGFTGVSVEGINQSMADLSAALENADSAVQLTVANSLWARKGFRFHSDFLERNRASYRAETTSLDFSDAGAPDVINGWVKGATHGLIDRIVDTISSETVLYLVNAIYFKGSWQVAFDPAMTNDGKFSLSGGGEKVVPMMRRSGSFKYAEDSKMQVLRLPYGAGRMGMYVFLPRTASGLSELLSTLDDRGYAEWISRLAPRDGDVAIPRFKIAYDCALSGALKALGMRDAFNPSAADFSKMSDGDLFISEVKHKAVVDVNEKGTEAAAVTSVEMRTTSIQEPEQRFSFVADRPFFFVIRDDATGSILFMGAMYDPSS